MRLLAQPAVLKQAVVAAALSTLAAWPRLAGWSASPNPTWFLAGVLFWAAFCMWAAVFAWHGQFSGRAVLNWKIPAREWANVTLLGVVGAVVLTYASDPSWRALRPQDFPASTARWVAQTLFYLGFEQLFAFLAPFALFLRLTGSLRAALVATALLRLVVLGLQLHATDPVPSVAGVLLLAGARVAVTMVVLILYLRGGLLPVWWVGLLLQLRHWFSLEAGR